MKAFLIGCVILDLLAFGLWCGYHLLRGLAAGFGTAGSAGGSGDVNVALALGLVLTLAACGLAFVLPPKIARIVVLLPLAFVVVAQWSIVRAERRRVADHDQRRAGLRAGDDALLASIPRDFRHQTNDDALLALGLRESFLIVDRERQVLARVDVAADVGIEAYAIGSLDQQGLTLYGTEAELRPFYTRFRDADGQTIFDRFTPTFRSRGNAAYDLERWRPAAAPTAD